MIDVSSLIRGFFDRTGFARRRSPVSTPAPNVVSFDRAGERRQAPGSAWYAEIPAPGRAEWFRQYCKDCREETPHHGFDEVGAGYYAQISRCRRCGREGMSIWPFA